MAATSSFVPWKRHVVFLLFVLSQVGNGHEDDVHTVQYTKDNFATELKKKHHFVVFYAPWCGHCQRLKPTWEQLAEISNGEDSNIKIAQVDCTTDNVLCNEHDVTGYPTLKFFKAGENKGTKYRGTRDLPSLISFINEELGSIATDNLAPSPPAPVSRLVELTEDNFAKHLSSGHHFVKFYVSRGDQPAESTIIWDELAKSLNTDDSVGISKVDCGNHNGVCANFDVKEYPTLLWIEDGKMVDKYTGPHTHEDLKAYVSMMVAKNNSQGNLKTDSSDNTAHTVLSLTGDSFKHGVEKGVSFVKFFAPWCGHCKRLAPTWEELGKKFFTNENVHIIKVDCTLDASKDLCNEQEVDGFPTLYLYRDGQKVSEYNGSRNLEDLYEFVINHLQKHDEL